MVFIVRRLSFAATIKRICKNNNYVFKPVGKFWFLSGISRRHCDFFIRTDKEVLCVKLCGFVLKRTHLVFSTPDSYSVKRLSFQLSSSVPAIQYTTYTKPEYDFEYNYPDEFFGLPKQNIILVFPAPLGALRIDGHKIVPAFAGDELSEGTLYNRSTFIDEIEGS